MAQSGAESDTGESRDVTPAAAAEDDGGPSALHFMWNHVPAKASPLIPSTTLRRNGQLISKTLDRPAGICCADGFSQGRDGLSVLLLRNRSLTLKDPALRASGLLPGDYKRKRLTRR